MAPGWPCLRAHWAAGANRLYLLEDCIHAAKVQTSKAPERNRAAHIVRRTARSPLNMPELNWNRGYPFVLSLMAAVALGMITFFKRKGWLRSRFASKEAETRD